MDVIVSPEAMQDRCWAWRGAGERVALVPTMGYFHEGHLSLMRWARAHADKVVVSLFVNPTQFGPEEDLDRYPRDVERDTALARDAGVDLLCTPQADALYAPEHATWVEVPALARHLCGASRPVHFKGVATIVTKLFMLAMPHVAVFGQKDWQQLALVRRMAADLNIPVRIEGRPIVREADGLALSSRNVYLSPTERALAPHLHKGLQVAAGLVDQGERDAAVLCEAVRDYWGREIGLGQEDYLSVVDPEAIVPVDRVDGPALMALAYRFERARLIDNTLLVPGKGA
ncbi:MAG: pantoate--beta-alanine ligase [Desulfovibrionaceae bacterium]